uniref:arginase family protein n=1 Tax=Bacillus thuringiensis TaxID=1428 RepID=UPI001642DEC7
QLATLCNQLPSNVHHIIEEPPFPLLLPPDHTIPIPTLAALPKHYKNLPLISFHPHRHLNTHQTSPSPNIHPISLPPTLRYPHSSLLHLYPPYPNLKKHNLLIIPPP